MFKPRILGFERSSYTSRRWNKKNTNQFYRIAISKYKVVVYGGPVHLIISRRPNYTDGYSSPVGFGRDTAYLVFSVACHHH